MQNSPFAKVKGGSTEGNPDREEYISYEQIEKAITVMGDNIELGGILAFARYAGLRRGEILRLRWSDFEYHNSERTVGIFQVRGKTGKRRVPVFSELIPNLEKIRTQKETNQEYVFAHYSQCTNVGKIIEDSMEAAGLKVWEKFFINQLPSCQTDKERLGWPRSVMDTVLGNTEHVRLKHYIQPMPDEDYAKLGQIGKGENLKFAEFPTIKTLFEGKLTYSDVLAAIGCDANARQKIFDCITSDPDLSVCYASVSALFKTVHGKQLWELLEEEQIKRANTFVQSAALHFEKVTKDFSNPLDRVGLEPTT